MAKSYFLGLKRSKSGFGPGKRFWPNWSKNDQKTAKRCFLGLKGSKK